MVAEESQNNLESEDDETDFANFKDPLRHAATLLAPCEVVKEQYCRTAADEDL